MDIIKLCEELFAPEYLNVEEEIGVTTTTDRYTVTAYRLEIKWNGKQVVTVRTFVTNKESYTKEYFREEYFLDCLKQIHSSYPGVFENRQEDFV